MTLPIELFGTSARCRFRQPVIVKSTPICSVNVRIDETYRLKNPVTGSEPPRRIEWTLTRGSAKPIQRPRTWTIIWQQGCIYFSLLSFPRRVMPRPQIIRIPRSSEFSHLPSFAGFLSSRFVETFPTLFDTQWPRNNHRFAIHIRTYISASVIIGYRLL